MELDSVQIKLCKRADSAAALGAGSMKEKPNKVQKNIGDLFAVS